MNLTKAPEKGLMYATYIDKMSFEPYCRDELTGLYQRRSCWNFICLIRI